MVRDEHEIFKSPLEQKNVTANTSRWWLIMSLEEWRESLIKSLTLHKFAGKILKRIPQNFSYTCNMWLENITEIEIKAFTRATSSLPKHVQELCLKAYRSPQKRMQDLKMWNITPCLGRKFRQIIRIVNS